MDYARGVMTARTNAGLSKRQLALKSGLTPGYITYIESGRKRPSLDVLERIAAALNIPVPLLFLFAADLSELRGIDPVRGAVLATQLQAIVGSDEES